MVAPPEKVEPIVAPKMEEPLNIPAAIVEELPAPVRSEEKKKYFEEDNQKEKQDLLSIDKKLEEIKKVEEKGMNLEVSKKEDDISDNYDDDFDEIEEDLPSDNDQIDFT